MNVFNIIFSWMFELLDILSVSIGGYRFSLGGAVIFAAIIILAVSFLRWLFTGDK